MLVTKCEYCVFKGNARCLIDHPIHVDLNDVQTTTGFCRVKRHSRWKVNERRNLTIWAWLDLVSKEESECTAMIISLDNNLNDIEKKLKSLKKINFITNVIVVVQKLFGSNYDNLIKILDASTKKWQLDNFMVSDPFSKEYIMDYSSRLLRTNWFFVLNEDEISSENQFKMKNHLDHEMNKMAAYKIGSILLINKFAFEDLSGNAIELFENKLKSYPNSSEVFIDESCNNHSQS